MRGCAAFLGIIAILMGLLISPFVHVHLEGDDSHGHDQAAVVHAHFPVPDSGRYHSSDPEIEDEHHHHHGSGVSALAANSRRIEPLFAIVQSANLLVERSQMPGYVVELTVRVHDPPSFGNSNPRSPPSC